MQSFSDPWCGGYPKDASNRLWDTLLAFVSALVLIDCLLRSCVTTFCLHTLHSVCPSFHSYYKCDILSLFSPQSLTLPEHYAEVCYFLLDCTALVAYFHYHLDCSCHRY